jgi:4-hydroxybenzoate polyprenyltransferase
VLLLLLSAALLVFLNWQTWLLSLVAVLLAASYPFMKRYTHLPQVVLGMAFSWGMPMCFMAIQQQLPLQVWLLYAANLCWTVAYDTYYALVDQNDDEKIGIKSTARLFGAYARPIIMTLQVIALLLMAATGWIQQLHVSFYFVISLALPLFYWQFNLSKTGRAGCFKAFLDNHYVGMLWFLAILIGIYWPNA